MKKILSIFSIGVILGSGTILSGGGIACGSNTPNPPGPTPNPPGPTPNPPTTKLSLSTITMPNINVTSENNGIWVNGQSAYDLIRNAIIAGYNGFFPNKDHLTQENFVYGTKTVTKDKPWALELSVSVRGKSSYLNTLISPDGETNLHVNHDQNLLQNDLILDINTINTNVLKSSGDNLSVYLNKFVFNNSDANKGKDLNIVTNKVQPEFVPDNVVDFTKAGDYHMDFTWAQTPPYTSVNHMVSYLNRSDNILKVSNAIINNINWSYNQHIVNPQLQSSIPKIQPLNNQTITANKITINQNTAIFYARENEGIRPKEGYFSLVPKNADFNNNKELYLKIKVSTWNYLTTNKYIAPGTTYIYAYLGITH